MTRRTTSESEPSPEQGGGSRQSRVTRRAVLAGAAGLGVGAGLERAVATSGPTEPVIPGQEPVAFYGPHQAGIATHPQAHAHVAALDLTSRSPVALRRLLREWSDAAAELTAGRPSTQARGEPGEAVGLAAAQLTVTFGLGPGLFAAGPAGGLGLDRRRPGRLAPLPAFAGEDLDPGKSGGDLCIQACANDPQVAFHAIHVMTRIGADDTSPRWSLSGFRPLAAAPDPAQTPRNLLGFKDGTNNIPGSDARALERFVWVQRGDGPRWLTGGSYLVVRQIELDLSTWDGLGEPAQNAAIGRQKGSGAPLGGRREHDPVNLRATDGRGNLVIPADAHIRVASDEVNGGVRILRRGYSYSRGYVSGRGAADVAQLDGGLLFIAFVRDPRQFITIQRRIATGDALSAFSLHVGSAIFACPPGASRGGFVGEGLLA